MLAPNTSNITLIGFIPSRMALIRSIPSRLVPFDHAPQNSILFRLVQYFSVPYRIIYFSFHLPFHLVPFLSFAFTSRLVFALPPPR